MERVGVLIGPEGQTKWRLEEATGATIEINSQTGDVTIHESEGGDPTLALKLRDIVTAVGRGFSEERAMKLLEPEAFLRVVDIKDYSRSRDRIAELKGRIIGSKGKTRGLIEELTGASVSVHGHTVAIIGDVLQMDVAGRAIEMLLQGSEHATVYRYLERMRAGIRVAEMGFP